MELAGKLVRESAMQDVAAADRRGEQRRQGRHHRLLHGRHLHLGASARLPGLAAAVGYYGGGILGMKDLRPLAPTMLHFGEKDDHIPLAGVHEFEKLHPEVPVYIYPAGHGFHCDERASYDAPSAKLAWGRTMEFFRKHVG